MNIEQAAHLVEQWAYWSERNLSGWPSQTVEARRGISSGQPPGPVIPVKFMPKHVARVDRIVRALDPEIPSECRMLQALWFGWQWFSPRLLTAKEVAMRMKHTTEAERVAAWEAGTGCSQATYYRYRKDLLLRVAASQRVE